MRGEGANVTDECGVLRWWAVGTQVKKRDPHACAEA